MIDGFFKKLSEIASRKKTDFRLQQEEVAQKYDEAIDCSVLNTTGKVEKYLEEQLSKFETR